MLIKNVRAKVKAHFCNAGQEYFDMLVTKGEIKINRVGNLRITTDQIFKLFARYRRVNRDGYTYANDFSSVALVFGIKNFFYSAVEKSIDTNPKKVKEYFLSELKKIK